MHLVQPASNEYDPCADESEFVGKSVLITGGTSGIGLACAKLLSDAGAHVSAVSLRDGVDESHARGTRIDIYAADVRNPSALIAVRNEVIRRRGKIDILVANAGINIRKPFEDFADEEIRLIIDTNLYGVLATLRTFGPLVVNEPSGRVIIMGSISSSNGQKNRAPYGATKAALSGLVRSLALEWNGSNGLTVNAVAPGIIHTPLISSYLQTDASRLTRVQEETPLGRLGTPDDVAKVVQFLASQSASYITGQTLQVDGGIATGNMWW